MPRSILDIDVNSPSFEAFAEKFKDFQEGLKKVPGEWGKTEKAVGGIADGFQAMTAAIMAQTLLLHEQVQEMEALDKAEAKLDRDKREAARDDAKRAQQRKRSTDELLGTYKGIAGFAAKTTVEVLKWVTMGSVVTGIFGGLLGTGGLFGLSRLADNISSSRRISAGLEMSPGDRQAFNINYAPYGMGDTFLEGVANAKNDVSKWGAFAAMGVNPQGKDPGTLGIELQKRAKTIWDGSSHTQQEAQARGLLEFFNMDQLRQLGRTRMSELDETQRQLQADKKQLAIMDDAAIKWQQFSLQLHRAGAEIEIFLVNALTPIIPKLIELSKVVVGMIGDFLKSHDVKKWINGLADEIQKFTNFLMSPKFHQDLLTFAQDVHLVVEGLIKGLRLLHLIPDGSTQDAPFGGGDAAAGAAAQLATRTGKDKASQDNAVMGWFIGRGWSKDQAAGIVANLEAESAMNPFAQGDKNKSTGRFEAFGIGQWHADRQAQYAKYFGHTMQSVTDRNRALAEQMAFVQYELTQGNFQGAGKELKGAANSYAAGALVSKLYERPKDDWKDSVASGRAQAAQVTVTVYNNTGGSASVSTNQLAQ